MKLFIWERNWRRDYYSGHAVVLANDVEEAKDLLRKLFPDGDEDGYEYQLIKESLESSYRVVELDTPTIVSEQSGTR